MKKHKRNRKYFILIIIIILFVVLSIARRTTDKESSLNKTDHQSQIPVIIVPHFDYFKTERQNYLNNLAKTISPKEIILVSVNHQNLGNADFITTDKEWQYQSAKVQINQDLFNHLTESSKVTADDSVFLDEHGIKNVIGDLATSFKEAQILPIIIKESAGKEKIEDLYSQISSNCQSCTIVASVDFSHYCPSSLAKVHDAYSISALKLFDEEKIWQAETDSPQTLSLAIKWAKSHGSKSFILDKNINSGEVDETVSETTSVVMGNFSSTDAKTDSIATFVVGGDLMFDRNVYHHYKDIGLMEIFKNFGTRPFRGVDLPLANLEGPISGSAIDDISTGSMVFNFPPETPSVLKKMNLSVVSLANNHTLNAGQSGFETTKKILTENKIKFLGSQEEFSKDNLLRVESAIPLSIIALDQLVNINQAEVNKMITEEEKAGRAVIVFPHWGVEYQAHHNSDQELLAHRWIDAGADIIIGSHPHVTQDFEIYKNRPIIYSLGNFVFDQYFSKETQEGLVIAGIINESEIKISFLPIKSIVSKPEFMTNKEKSDKIKSVLNINSQEGFTKISNDTISISINK